MDDMQCVVLRVLAASDLRPAVPVTAGPACTHAYVRVSGSRLTQVVTCKRPLPSPTFGDELILPYYGKDPTLGFVVCGTFGDEDLPPVDLGRACLDIAKLSPGVTKSEAVHLMAQRHGQWQPLACQLLVQLSIPDLVADSTVPTGESSQPLEDSTPPESVSPPQNEVLSPHGGRSVGASPGPGGPAPAVQDP
eukprot:gene2257-3128_t